jgi:hypothetical protein
MVAVFGPDQGGVPWVWGGLRRNHGAILLRTLAALLCAASTEASAADARLTGLVLDPTGAVIPGAEVILLGPDGLAIGGTTTDARGAFSFEGLLPGRYEARAHHAGFKDGHARAVVSPSPKGPLEIRLEVARVVEEVTIGGEPSTQSSENRDSVSVERSFLDDLPVLDLDYVSALTPFLDQGAVGSDGVSLIVDGAEANRVLVSPSAIQSVKINQNPYSAEYFRPGRGRIEIVTKEGEPEYHGTFNLLYRNSSLDAQAPFAPEKAPEARRVYEGELSGPLGKAKGATFLLSFERQENDLQSVVNAVEATGALRENVPTPARDTQFSGRLTERWNDQHSTWAEYAFEDHSAQGQGIGQFTLPAAGTNSSYREDDLDLSDQFSRTTFVNQAFVHLEWNHGATTSLTPGGAIVVQGAFTAGGAEADSRQTEMDLKFFDVFSWTVGKHLLKAGLQAAEWSHRTYDDLTNRDGTYYFSSLAAYEAGTPYAFTQQAGNGEVALFQQILGGFVQDEIRLRPGLTLALGLRYDHQNFLHGGRLAPRVFAAFSPGNSRSLVLRAGIGVFNDRFPPSAFASVLQHDGLHLRSFLVSDPTYPDVVPLGAEPENVTSLAPDIVTPQNIQYSLGAERTLGKGSTLSLTYRGSRGVDVFRSRDVNAPVGPSFAARPDPEEGQVRVIESAGRQVSDALEMTLRAKLGRSFTSLAQYTLSRTLNNTSGINFFPANSADPLAEWGLADFDQTHRLNLLGTLDVHWAKIGLGLNAASGVPYSLTTGLDTNRDGILNDRPLGVGRNTLRTPATASLDVRIAHEILFGAGDKAPKATLGLNLFNLLNSFNPTQVEADLASPLYGRPIAALPGRRAQISVQFTF